MSFLASAFRNALPFFLYKYLYIVRPEQKRRREEEEDQEASEFFAWMRSPDS